MPAGLEGDGGVRENFPEVRRGALASTVFISALATAAPLGAANPQLAGLQVALRAHGLYAGAIDGVQGPRTRTALRAFQRRHGLVPDGLAGPRTRAKLGRLGTPLYGRRVLHRGLVGWDVAVLQFLLRERGFPAGKPDGRFGAKTVEALVAFQRSAQLPPDGVLGRRTARKLCSLPSCAFHPPKPKPRFLRYLVEPGDTLTAIADRYGLSLGTIARINRLDPARTLFAGATLRIPVSAARRSAAGKLGVQAVLDRWAAHYGVDRHLVRGLAWMESGYQQDVVSAVGARGVMQITDQTWAYVETVLLGRPVSHDLDGNVQVGVAYLRELLREFDGDAGRALAAYVQGPRSVREAGLLPETRLYVLDVLALRERL
jgi:peptidoglycan hydrolase-like protein with peptidoglycan-binding domain